MDNKDTEFNKTIVLIKRSAKEISYEIVWATPRILPSIAYLLLEAHPHHKIGYTPMLSTAIIIIKENIQIELCLWGIIIQITETRKNIIMGAKINNILLEL